VLTFELASLAKKPLLINIVAKQRGLDGTMPGEHRVRAVKSGNCQDERSAFDVRQMLIRVDKLPVLALDRIAKANDGLPVELIEIVRDRVTLFGVFGRRTLSMGSDRGFDIETAALGLSACGGGGGGGGGSGCSRLPCGGGAPTTPAAAEASVAVSGSAATGAPASGSRVALRCANGPPGRATTAASPVVEHVAVIAVAFNADPFEVRMLAILGNDGAEEVHESGIAPWPEKRKLNSALAYNAVLKARGTVTGWPGRHVGLGAPSA